MQRSLAAGAAAGSWQASGAGQRRQRASRELPRERLTSPLGPTASWTSSASAGDTAARWPLLLLDASHFITTMLKGPVGGPSCGTGAGGRHAARVSRPAGQAARPAGRGCAEGPSRAPPRRSRPPLPLSLTLLHKHTRCIRAVLRALRCIVLHAAAPHARRGPHPSSPTSAEPTRNAIQAAPSGAKASLGGTEDSGIWDSPGWPLATQEAPVKARTLSLPPRDGSPYATCAPPQAPSQTGSASQARGGACVMACGGATHQHQLPRSSTCNDDDFAISVHTAPAQAHTGTHVWPAPAAPSSPKAFPAGSGA